MSHARRAAYADAKYQLSLLAQCEQPAGEYRIKAGTSLLLLRQWVEQAGGRLVEVLR